MSKITSLPDITSEYISERPNELQWVGMEEVAIPLCFHGDDGRVTQINAHTDLYVNLQKADAKGIHMSRLYALINQFAGSTICDQVIADTLIKMVESQQGISNAARINCRFELMLAKPALKSEGYGYQSYPVQVNAQYKDEKLQYQLELTIPYSSTCPCSASLSRQLFHDEINRRFNSASIDKAALLDWVLSQSGTVATPHSQRSYAYVKLSINEHKLPDIGKLITKLESVISTPVQTLVKREDEQEFARLNAENLMFCEDAARRIKHALEDIDYVNDYWFKVEHQESLHAHNAVVIDQKY